MSKHTTISPAEAADRLAIRELVDVADTHFVDGAWLFAERRLYVDWLEERALS